MPEPAVINLLPRLNCPKCHGPLPAALLSLKTWNACPACQTPLQYEMFPALFRPAARAVLAENVMLDGEASCFYHAQKRAVVPCASCGRFLCALCDCELHGEHFCPACLETGKKKGKDARLVDKRPLYGNQALTLACVPLLITALIAIYFVFRYRRSPGSLITPKPWLMTVAFIIACLQIAGFVLLFFGSSWRVN